MRIILKQSYLIFSIKKSWNLKIDWWFKKVPVSSTEDIEKNVNKIKFHKYFFYLFSYGLKLKCTKMKQYKIHTFFGGGGGGSQEFKYNSASHI